MIKDREPTAAMVEEAREILARGYEKRGWPETAARIRSGKDPVGEADSAPMLAVLEARAMVTASPPVDHGRVADEIATTVAERCNGKRKAPQRYAIIWQAARLGALAALTNKDTAA